MMSMRYFTEEYLKNFDLGDEVIEAYNAHIESDKNSFPRNVIDFAKQVSLHDTICISSKVNIKSKRLMLSLTDPDDANYKVVTINYRNAIISKKDMIVLYRLATDTRYFVAADEFDRLENDFVHRILLGVAAGFDGVIEIMFKKFEFSVENQRFYGERGFLIS